jgi:hypothetical protein
MIGYLWVIAAYRKPLYTVDLYALVRAEGIPDEKVYDYVYDDVYDICESWKLFDYMTDEERADVLELVKLLRGKPTKKEKLKDLEERFWVSAAADYLIKNRSLPVKFRVVEIPDIKDFPSL